MRSRQTILAAAITALATLASSAQADFVFAGGPVPNAPGPVYGVALLRDYATDAQVDATWGRFGIDPPISFPYQQHVNLDLPGVVSGVFDFAVSSTQWRAAMQLTSPAPMLGDGTISIDFHELTVDAPTEVLVEWNYAFTGTVADHVYGGVVFWDYTDNPSFPEILDAFDPTAPGYGTSGSLTTVLQPGRTYQAAMLFTSAGPANVELSLTVIPAPAPALAFLGAAGLLLRRRGPQTETASK